MQIQLMMIRLLQSSNTLQRFTAKRECWAIHFLIKLSSHSAIRIVGVDTISGSLSKFSQIPGVSFFQTITGTDPPKPRFIAHLGIGEKHQSYSLGFIFSNLARNTVDISWYDTRKSPTGCSWGPNDLNSTQAWLGNGWIHSKFMGPTTENVGSYRKNIYIKKTKKNMANRKNTNQTAKKNKGTKFKNRGKSRFWVSFVFMLICFSYFLFFWSSFQSVCLFGESAFDSVFVVFFRCFAKINVLCSRWPHNSKPFNDSIASSPRHHEGLWCKGPLPATQEPRPTSRNQMYVCPSVYEHDLGH